MNKISRNPFLIHQLAVERNWEMNPLNTQAGAPCRELEWYMAIILKTKKSFPFAVGRCTYRGLVKCAKGPTRVLLRWENLWFQTVALSVSSNVFVCAGECE